MSDTTKTEVKLAPCPFCGCKPKISLGKKSHCQLHGEPSQGIIVFCDWKDCVAKPKIEAGNIYNGIGDALYKKEATEEAIKAWNTRPSQALDVEWPSRKEMLVASESGNVIGWNDCHDAFISALKQKGLISNG